MSTEWIDRYREHFQRYFGKPFDVQVYHDNQFGVKVATHDLAMHRFGVLASLGMADQLAREGEEEFGEVILFTDMRDKAIPAIFVNALFFILQNNIPLNSRFAINFERTQPEFAERVEKSALYFTRPALPDFFFADDPINQKKIGQDTFDKIRVGDAFGRVFQAIFITAQEDAYLETSGHEAFERELRAAFGDETEEDTSTAITNEYSRAITVRRPSCV